MALDPEDKKAAVAEVTAQVAKASTIVAAGYCGITIGGLTKLRAQTHQQGIYLRILKNTLTRRAIKGTPFAEPVEQLTDPLIYGISEDAVALAKVLSDFTKGNDRLVLCAGSHDGRVLDVGAMKALTTAPSRGELFSKPLFVMQAPVSDFARALGAPAAKQGESEVATT